MAIFFRICAWMIFRVLKYGCKQSNQVGKPRFIIMTVRQVIDIIRGAGQLSIEEKIIEFGPDHTLLIPLLSINSSIVEV
jgi:hypothetical protein